MAKPRIDREDIENGQDEFTQEVDQYENQRQGDLWETLDRHDESKGPDDEAAELFDEFKNGLVFLRIRHVDNRLSRIRLFICRTVIKMKGSMTNSSQIFNSLSIAKLAEISFISPILCLNSFIWTEFIEKYDLNKVRRWLIHIQRKLIYPII